MAKVKLGLKFLTLLEKIELARQIVIKMTANTAYTTPTPPLLMVDAVASGTGP